MASALERARELDQEKLVVLERAAEDALSKATEAVRELAELVQEQIETYKQLKRQSARCSQSKDLPS